MAAIKQQDPQAVLDYVFDWTAWLNGDTIATSSWVAPGLTVVSNSFTNTSTTAFLSGGMASVIYKVRNHITTAQGRTEEETFDLQIRDH
jgi:hypothetical protein